MEFILANLTVFIEGFIGLAILVYAIYTKQWGTLKVGALQLMLSAERLIDTEEGKEKFDEVFAKVWAKVPTLFKKFITEDKFKVLLQKWYDIAKDKLKEQNAC